MTTFPASIHFRLPTELRSSTIQGAGLGLFALARASRGSYLGLDFPNPERLEEADKLQALPPSLRCHAWRLIEHVCFAPNPDRRSAADFLNHSFEPNILIHAGHYFALQDIEPGDELFVDYRFVFDPSWGGALVDVQSGKAVVGFEWREALRRSTSLLLEILESAPDNPPKGLVGVWDSTIPQEDDEKSS